MNDWSILATIVAAAALVVSAVTLGVLWLALHRARVRLGLLHGLVTRLVDAQAPLEARLDALAAQLREDRAFASPTAASAGRAYELAAHLAASGVGIEQLVAQCGLTPAEAELAVRIHGLRARTRAA
jgi:hypothetical protein